MGLRWAGSHLGLTLAVELGIQRRSGRELGNWYLGSRPRGWRSRPRTLELVLIGPQRQQWKKRGRGCT